MGNTRAENFYHYFGYRPTGETKDEVFSAEGILEVKVGIRYRKIL